MPNPVRVAVFALLLGVAQSAPAQISGEISNSDRIDRLLSDAVTGVSRLKSDIATLDFLVISQGDSQTYSSMLTLYSGRAAALRAHAAALSASRKDASKWQQPVIDHVVPLLGEFASAAEAAIGRARANRDRLRNPEYRNYLKLNSDLSDELSDIIGAWVRYGKTRAELEQTAAQLSAASPSF